MTRRATERVAAAIDKRGVTTSFAWGFSEATLFFFVPDIAVGAVALFGIKRGLKAAGAAIAGALLGGLLMFAVAAAWPEAVRSVLDRLPGIPDRFFDTARESARSEDGLAIVRAPGRGIPYKIYAAEWGASGRSLLELLAWTVPARAFRIVPAAIVSWVGARLWRRLFGPDRLGGLLSLYLAAWVAVYVVYFAAVGF